MQYFARIESDQHFLYAWELAEKYSILSKNGKPHSGCVAAILNLYLNNGRHPKMYIYFYSRYGMRQVYQNEPELIKFLHDLVTTQPTNGDTYNIFINDTTFKIQANALKARLKELNVA